MNVYLRQQSSLKATLTSGIRRVLLLWIICGGLMTSCQDPRVADQRLTCRSEIDCALESMTCLPLYAGETLTEYCAEASCPDVDGFKRFSDQRAMVKVCDLDLDEDGIADITSKYQPLGASIVGSDDVSLLFSQKDRLIIPGLFIDTSGYNVKCPVGLEEVTELELCLTPQSAQRFCDRDADCDSTSYCSLAEALCVPKFAVGRSCAQSNECASGVCNLERCVDGALASRCALDQDCESGLRCTGQQSAAPNFSPTDGPRVCGDGATLFSPCDPAILPCERGDCVEVEFGRYGSACASQTIYESSDNIICGEAPGCVDVCERLSGFGDVFICVE